MKIEYKYYKTRCKRRTHMILSEDINEFIYNMKLKKSVLGGIKEESVYENMRKLSDMYEAQISEMKKQLKTLQEQNDNTTRDYNEMKQKLTKEINSNKRNYIDRLKIHQVKISQFMEACESFSEEVQEALEKYQQDESESQFTSHE